MIMNLNSNKTKKICKYSFSFFVAILMVLSSIALINKDSLNIITKVVAMVTSIWLIEELIFLVLTVFFEKKGK